MRNEKLLDMVNTPTIYNQFYLKSVDEIRLADPVITSDEILSYINTVDTDEAISFDGKVTVDFLCNPPSGIAFNHSAREYQREKLADTKWKQGIMETIFCNAYKRIPPLHLRLVRIYMDDITYLKIENVDGRQRASALIDFVNGEFVLGQIPPVLGVDISGKYFNELKEKYPPIYQLLMDYRLSCIWYDNISDDETADLFVEILNNNNSMKPQEMRNAVRGNYSTFVRDIARPVDGPHKSTHFLHRSKTDTGKEFLTYMPKISLSGRMEVDEWISELIYMYYNGWKNGISQPKHTQWVKNEQKSGIFSTESQWKHAYQKEIKSLIEFASKIIKAFPDERRNKLTSMFGLILIHYGYEIYQQYENIIESIYIKKFLEIYDNWNDETKKLYINEVQINGTQMPQMSALFNGKNTNAIKSIVKILDKTDKIEQWGVVELDSRKSFKRDDIMRKVAEQKWQCPFTGINLMDKVKLLVGDHRIPRSKGIKAGGITGYDNLVVTTQEINRKKLTMSSEDFSKWCETFK